MLSNIRTTTIRERARGRALLLACALALSLAACGGGGSGDGATAGDTDPTAAGESPGGGSTPSAPANDTPAAPTTPNTADGSPAAGNPLGHCAVPAAGQPRSTVTPTTVVGNGTPASCTSQAVVDAVANGGVVTFNCGADPVTITMGATARIFNNKPDLVLDGGGKVTLSGGGVRRILYQNTCDPALVWMSSSCQLDDSPKTVVQNITLADGNSSGQSYGITEVYGGGAIYARGGRLAIINTRFFRNRCESAGPDLGGAAVRALEMSAAAPVVVAGSTFGGAEGYGNSCSNGGGLSSIGTSYAVINSLFSHNRAVGTGANPARAGTPGGGNGGGIYMDGTRFDLSLCGTAMRNNSANEGGGAIIYVSNDLTGTMSIRDSTFSANPSAGFETQGLPGMFVLAAPGQPVISGSTLSP
jgi:hypothetical protein